MWSGDEWGWKDGQKKGWKDGRMEGWMDGRKDGRMDGSRPKKRSRFKRVSYLSSDIGRIECIGCIER